MNENLRRVPGKYCHTSCGRYVWEFLAPSILALIAMICALHAGHMKGGYFVQECPTVLCVQVGTIVFGIFTSPAKVEAKQRKLQEHLSSRSLCISLEDSVAMHPEEEIMDSKEFDLGTVDASGKKFKRSKKSVVKVTDATRHSHVPWESEVDTPPWKKAGTSSSRHDDCQDCSQKRRSRHDDREHWGLGQQDDRSCPGSSASGWPQSLMRWDCRRQMSSWCCFLWDLDYHGPDLEPSWVSRHLHHDFICEFETRIIGTVKGFT